MVVLVLVLVLLNEPVAHADDLTPPGLPNGIAVTQGAGWQASDQFNVTWNNPVDEPSPIVAAHYELCTAGAVSVCETSRVAEFGINSLNIQLPEPGLFALYVWLEDAAGNVNATVRSAPQALRFDPMIPPLPAAPMGSEWATTEAPLSLVLQLPLFSEWPLSGIAGYSLSLDGSSPDALIDAYAQQDYDRFRSQFTIPDIAEGITVVMVRAVSGSGLASGSRVSAIKVDRTPPQVSAPAMPPSDRWLTEPVAVELVAQDQAHLSGMTGSAPEDPVEDGGFVEYTVDGGPAVRERGGGATVKVAEDGQHSLSYRAVDVAGNSSVERMLELKIDQTPPAGGFELQDPLDPRMLSVLVHDATSGLASGRIDYRRRGSQAFLPLHTTLASGRLTARIDDLALEAGRYDFRALVSDRAGNETSLDARLVGGAMVLDLPVRLGTRVEASLVTRCGSRTGSPARTRRRHPPSRRRCGGVPLVRYGRALPSRGRLTTAQGVPVAGAAVLVESRPRGVAAFTPVGVVRTDRAGTFRFVLPPGPSRLLRYRYAGTGTLLPSGAQLAMRVRAAATLAVDRRRLRNGQAVRFRGRLAGRPLPAAGKLVALQARVGREWRTFATPRANGRGVFRHRYRFTSTTGLRRYAFRALVTRESAYPYERGLSRTVRVTVRGS